MGPQETTLLSKTPLNVQSALLHGMIALMVSFGLSALFVFSFGGGDPIHFLLVSSLCGGIAALFGWMLVRRLWLTAIKAALVRCAVFVIFLGPT